MALDQSPCKLHAIIFPFPFQGHITPAVNLALKFASKRVTVTFVQLEFAHHTLSQAQNRSEQDFFSEAQRSGLDIRYTTLSDGLPFAYNRNLHFEEYLEVLSTDYTKHVDEFIEKTIRSDPNLIPFIVADTSYVWIAKVAKKYSLKSVTFWTQSALVFSLVRHSDLLKKHGHFPCKDDVEEDIRYIPGVESINTKDIMPYLKESASGTFVPRVIIDISDLLEEVDFVLQNVVQELELETLSAPNKIQPNYAIGPINFSKTLSETVTKSLFPESDCSTWLSSKRLGSVLYVSFGSLAQIDKQVVEEIANGLLLSEVNFIWVVRSDLVSYDSESGILPNGFMDDIKDRGLIVPWCNQVTVLSDPAVQGFVTHCGWNSVLESIWCGVPMICYPVSFDQPTNRKLVVDDWKIGINLYDGKSVEREKVAQKIKSVMHGATSEGLKQEMKKVTDMFHRAMKTGGSSDRNFDKFVLDLKNEISSTTSTHA